MTKLVFRNTGEMAKNVTDADGRHKNKNIIIFH